MSLSIPAASIRHRKEFNSACKNADETVENWYQRLKELAEPCEYGTYLEAFVLHQFICGLDVWILDHFNAEKKDLSLIDVFELMKNYERNNEPDDVVSTNVQQPFICCVYFQFTLAETTVVEYKTGRATTIF